MSADGSVSRERKRHTFLFRHCVRSTKSKVKLYNGNQDALKHAADYTTKKIPKWNTPEEWCTETGIEIMRNTGAFVLENILLRDGEAAKNIKVQFLADTSQRDVDTALAMSLGMQDAARKFQGLQVDGLADLRLDHALFEPLEPDELSTTTRCATYFSTNQTADDIEQRIKDVLPPEPGLIEMLKLIEALGGVGKAGKLGSIEPRSDYSLNRTELKLAGAVNVVKLFGEMMFYSRASGIYHPFLQKATLEDVYQILEWVSWSRSVLSIDNVEVTTQGAVIAEFILKSMEGGQFGELSCPDDYDLCATVLVGHDSTIDAVASALGLRWKLRPPYLSGKDSIGEYVPTPPGGGMHFMYNEQSDTLELSYLYPVYFTGHESKWELNTTGILESVPMSLTLPIYNLTSYINSSIETTVVSSLNSVRSSMRNRMFSILTQYPGSLDCYSDIQDHQRVTSPQSELPMELRGESYRYFTFAAMILTFSVVLCTLLIIKRTRTSDNREKYELAEGVEQIELM